MLVNVTIPVFNAEKNLATAIVALHGFLSANCRFAFEIVISENGSNDKTRDVAKAVSRAFSNVRVICAHDKGRGGAIRRAWLESKAEILSYMDVDLSSDLFAFPPMIEALLSTGFDLATGSRLLKTVTTKRSFRREVLSRTYNHLIKSIFRTTFSDAQCGFKAATRRAVVDLLPRVENDGWFFDTELLVI